MLLSRNHHFEREPKVGMMTIMTIVQSAATSSMNIVLETSSKKEKTDSIFCVFVSFECM